MTGSTCSSCGEFVVEVVVVENALRGSELYASPRLRVSSRLHVSASVSTSVSRVSASPPSTGNRRTELGARFSRTAAQLHSLTPSALLLYKGGDPLGFRGLQSVICTYFWSNASLQHSYWRPRRCDLLQLDREVPLSITLVLLPGT